MTDARAWHSPAREVAPATSCSLFYRGGDGQTEVAWPWPFGDDAQHRPSLTTRRVNVTRRHRKRATKRGPGRVSGRPRFGIDWKVPDWLSTDRAEKKIGPVRRPKLTQ